MTKVLIFVATISKYFQRKIAIICLSISLNMRFGAQKNRFNKAVLLSTNNICKKIIFSYALLSGGLACKKILSQMRPK